MFKTLIATCLLTFSSCTGIKTQEHEYKTTVQRAYNSNSVLGAYNFVDDFSLNHIIDNDLSFTINLEPNYQEDVTFLNPIFINGFYQWVRSISFDYRANLNYCEVEVKTYTYDDVPLTYGFAMFDNDDLTEIELTGNPFRYLDTIIYVRNVIRLNNDEMKIFNSIFTTDDNIYTTSYNGYYNFYNTTHQIPQTLFVVGYMSFNSSTYDSFTNNLDTNVVNNSLKFSYYNTQLDDYNFVDYSLDDSFVKNYSVNLLMNGVKMPISTYDALSIKGVFSYVRDTSYDDTTFVDMLFSIADTPVYFISRLLNFELFGFNLFIAFTSLLTLALVIVCIRKFW